MEKYAVLMAVYYKEKGEHLRLAIESMLQQTLPPEEFVLVCDGPLPPELDGVIQVFCIRHPELFRVVRLEKNMGLGQALNRGLQHCSLDLVARMDSDDISLRCRMELLLEEMEREERLSVVGGQIAEFRFDPARIEAYRIVPCEEAAIRKFLTRRSPMNHTTVLMRKSHVLAVGGYPDLPGFEDYVLWAKLLGAGYRLHNVPQVCCKVRAGAGMYHRRGGMAYFCNTVKMERFLRREGLIGSFRFHRNLAVRFLGTVVLMPTVRRWAFLRFLRKKNREPEARVLPVRLAREPAGSFFRKP